jgi:hypothetical protein
MISALLLTAALLAQAGGPHFSDDPEAVATPGATQTSPTLPATGHAAPVKVVGTRAAKISAEENKEDPVSCQTYETTGTRFTTKHCLRRSQWEQLARDAKDNYETWSSSTAITKGH